MSSIKPLVLYSHALGPNPWKVALLLEELALPYTAEYKDFSELKGSAFDSEINPNGRVPALTDPNTGINIWESGAIIEYLIEVYDKEGKLHYVQTPQRWYTQQFLHYQMSGQGTFPPNFCVANPFLAAFVLTLFVSRPLLRPIRLVLPLPQREGHHIGD